MISWLVILIAACALFYGTYRLGEWICGRMAVQSEARQDMRRRLGLHDPDGGGSDPDPDPGEGASPSGSA